MVHINRQMNRVRLGLGGGRTRKINLVSGGGVRCSEKQMRLKKVLKFSPSTCGTPCQRRLHATSATSCALHLAS